MSFTDDIIFITPHEAILPATQEKAMICMIVMNYFYVHKNTMIGDLGDSYNIDND